MDAAKGPIAGRLKRPSWQDPRLLVGVGLVLIALIGTSAAIAGADSTEPFYAARGTLTPGSTIQLEDVVLVNVRVSTGEYAASPEEIEGMVATRVVGEGELVPLSALEAPERYVARPVAVTTSLPLSQDVERGSVVDVWVTREGPAGTTSSLIAGAVVVDEVTRESGAFSGGGNETVYVMIPEAKVGTFLAELASDGEVAVVRVAAGS